MIYDDSFFIVLGLLLAATTAWSLWDGEIIAFGGGTRRNQEPKLFWLFVVTLMLVSVTAVVYGVLSVLDY